MSPHSTQPCTPDDIYHDVLKALQKRQALADVSPLGYMRMVKQASRETGGTAGAATEAVLDQCLSALRASQPEAAEILHLRFWMGKTAHSLAKKFPRSVSSINRLQKNAVLELAKVLLQKEEQCLSHIRTTYFRRLEPASNQETFGVEAIQSQLLQLVAPGSPHNIITLEGMGGIGKTTLADSTIRLAIEQDLFDDFGWVSARQSRFQPLGGIHRIDTPALKVEELLESLCLQLLGEEGLPKPFSVDGALARLLSHLHEFPSLIVIDNLETVTDIDALLPILQRLTAPTKFILTSREQVYREFPTLPFEIPSLTEKAAFALLRHEASFRQQPDLAKAEDAQLRLIFKIVGGNPLALKLVVGQTSQFGLDIVLTDLEEAASEAADNLYTFIYKYAWSNLDEISQQVLLAMPLIPETGETVAYIEGILRDLPAEKVRNGLGKLVSLYLVNKQGDFTNRFYSIHNLTRTFLLKQVLKWQQ